MPFSWSRLHHRDIHEPHALTVVENDHGVEVDLGDRALPGRGRGGEPRDHRGQGVESAVSGPGLPRAAGAILRAPIISFAAASDTGASRIWTSLSTSAWMPPAPTITTGPNAGSSFEPTITSTPVGAICCTSARGGTPSGPGDAGQVVPGGLDRCGVRECGVDTAEVALVDDAVTESFIATRGPSAAAAAPASSRVVTRRHGTTGRPAECHQLELLGRRRSRRPVRAERSTDRRRGRPGASRPARQADGGGQDPTGPLRTRHVGDREGADPGGRARGRQPVAEAEQRERVAAARLAIASSVRPAGASGRRWRRTRGSRRVP